MEVNEDHRNQFPADVDSALAALTDAQRRASEQRSAAEKLLEDARLLEQRLAAEAEKARHAAASAQAARLQQAAEHARTLEAEAAESAQTATLKREGKAKERVAAEAQARARHEEKDAAEAELTKAEALLADARQKLERAKVALLEAAEHENKAISAEDGARIEAAESAQVLRDRRAARENLEEELRAVQERYRGFEGEVPSLSSIGQLDEIQARTEQISEAARRIAERRAADAARRALRS
jgi:myosin heavy subunit